MAKFKRGDICVREADPTGPLCTIQGGPTHLYSGGHYSVRWEGQDSSSTRYPRVIHQDALVLHKEAVDAPSADCPNCGIEDMLFYFDDYICAWCREQLEDG